VKQLDLVGLARCTNNLNCKQGEYIVLGLNFIWSIDGHNKLAEWGFQIYGGIDAYARNIIWIYVGISNRTS
jgi:alpha-tubulin suppressor-like RCC1 family protein